MSILDGFKKRLAEAETESEKANLKSIINHWEKAEDDSDKQGE